MEHRKAVFSGVYGLSGTLLNATGREFGAGEWTRTTDPRITNALLCQLSYTGHERRQSIIGWRAAWNLWILRDTPGTERPG